MCCQSPSACTGSHVVAQAEGGVGSGVSEEEYDGKTAQSNVHLPDTEPRTGIYMYAHVLNAHRSHTNNCTGSSAPVV